MVKIGIYLGCGSDNPQNIEKELIAWGKALEGYEAELFGTAEVPDSIKEYYECYRTRPGGHENPLSKIKLAFRHTREYIGNTDPDILVQLWCYPTHGPGLTTAAKVSGTPSIVRFPGDHFKEYDAFKGADRILAYGLHNAVGRLPLRIADQIITLGPYGKSEVVSQGANERDINILPPAAGIEERFSPPTDKNYFKRKLGIPVDHRVLLYVGRLSGRKGMAFLMDVIAELETTDEVSFVLVGDGEYRQKFQRDFGGVNIITPGYVEYQDIHEYYKAADVYVHPSKYEGIPLTILEALNCGLPVVARDAGDISFIIQDVVDSPAEMASIIQNTNYSTEWRNKELFNQEYHTQKVKSIVEQMDL